MAPVVIDVKKADDNRDIVHRAVQALAEGNIVAFPTESLYGLAASAEHPTAVQRMRELQGRAESKPFSMAVKSSDAALDYVPGISPLGQRLSRRCWPGPVTIVTENHHQDSLLRRLPEETQKAISPTGKIGLRVPAHDLLLDVLRLSRFPVAFTSADLDGQASAVTAQDVLESFPDDSLRLVLDDGACRYGQPASLVEVEGNQWRMLREGVLNANRLRWFTNLMVVFVCTGNTCRSPMAEGMFRARAAARLGCEPNALEEHGLMVFSAGIAAMQGGQSSPEAVEAMSAKNIDLTQHQSQPLTEQLVRFADQMLTMTNAHRYAILNRWPEAGARIHVLCRDGADVGDPIGGPLTLYQRCADQIESQLDAWLDDLGLDQLPTSGAEQL